ncbi:MAG: UbiA-like polyprenyltransferase [Chitinophagaceae bacterium]
MLKKISHYLSLIKFSHTIFAMPFAIIGFFLGYRDSQHLNATKNYTLIFSLILLCMVFARSAAMAFNRYIDEKYDKMNPRTALREIPAGLISKPQALLFIIANSILFIVCTSFINVLCFMLSPIALFVILFYSYTKRFTALCHIVLGVGLALAPIGAYLAVTGHFATAPLLFSLVVLTWVSGFDILYALQDEDFDKEFALRSIPVYLGRKKSMQLSIFIHVVTAILVLGIGYVYLNQFFYWLGALLFIALLIYQHTLVKPHDISKINLAFGTTNGIAGVVFSVFVIASIIHFL